MLYNRQVRSLPLDAVLKNPFITYPILIVFFGMTEYGLSVLRSSAGEFCQKRWYDPSGPSEYLSFDPEQLSVNMNTGVFIWYR